MKTVKIGDLVKVHGGYVALVLGIELLYPSHAASPPRNYEVQFVGNSPSWATCKMNDIDVFLIDAFSVIGIANG